MSDTITAAVREELSLLTADQVCELLQVSKEWLYDEVQRGRFPHVRLGRRTLRFRAREVAAFLDGSWKVPETPVAPAGLGRRGRPRNA